MSVLSPFFEPVIQPALNKAASVIPIHWQVRGVYAFQNLKQRIGKSRPVPVFSEALLPEVSTRALQDIDLSNPFLYRQGLWHSYFKRLRDECPVHYQNNSPFGPFWSVTRYEDIMFVDTRHEPFDWVQRVSIELTSRMLATLFDFPFEQRQKLAYWSDVATSSPETTGGTSNAAEAFKVAADMARQMSLLWREKEARKAAGEEAGFDLISLLLANESTRDIDQPAHGVYGEHGVGNYSLANAPRAFDEDPDQFRIDRKNVRKHLSFGFGVHRCMGNRLAEMQLRILWEEILKRFEHIEVLDEPGYVQSNFVRGYTRMNVKLKGIDAG